MNLFTPRLLMAHILPGLTGIAAPAQSAAPVRVVVGLVHGHVKRFLHNLPQSENATLAAHPRRQDAPS